ncbi:hypothetical protein SEVIR_7G220700v4 [Setaria viridis]|uniref:Uncharacterized protein n=2 Tax=Setaria TaxID=4554 RepID=K3YAT4_SETIT|nr:hypothetical protein SETIT_7G208900v2 [Setaria italica]TKW06117.1 hypothetical protein SEVIR_7G220700v2 [Setaria viridis]
MSSGGGRSSLGYLFQPEETSPYHTTAKSNQETEKTTPDTNSSSVKDDNKMIGAGADKEPPQLPPPNREVSNPILSSNRSPCNIYHTSQLSYNNSGFLITDRPSTRVRCAPGGPSSLGFLFGEEHEK